MQPSDPPGKGKRMINRYDVGAVGKRVAIANLPRRPELTPKEALELAAWLVATAAPLMQGEPSDVLGQFHKMIAAAGDGEGIAVAALEAIED
jgi:hypothetical protein